MTAPAAAVQSRPPADAFMRRLLRVPDQRPPGTKRPDVHKAFSTSIMISAARCVLTYIVLPFIAPAVGFAKGFGPWIGIPTGVVAIFFNYKSIRRFWLADHKWRWAYTAIGSSVIVLLLVLITHDLVDLFT
jgi:hypothetical protein